MKRIRIVGAVVLLMGAGAVAVGMVLAPGHDLKEIERAYEKELRAAQEQIAKSRSVLDENSSRLHELWEQALAIESAEKRAELRPEFEQLVRENSRLEIEIAELEVKVAEMGLKLAMERLVQARVSLREAQIKLHRRERWLEGDWGDRLRRGRFGPRRDRPADTPTTDQPSSDGPADGKPESDEAAADESATDEQDAPKDDPAR